MRLQTVPATAAQVIGDTDKQAPEVTALERLVSLDIAARMRAAAADLLWQGPLASMLEEQAERFEGVAEGIELLNTSPASAAEWNEFIASAPNFADAQDRMEQAVIAGVDFAALAREQGNRGELRT